MTHEEQVAQRVLNAIMAAQAEMFHVCPESIGEYEEDVDINFAGEIVVNGKEFNVRVEPVQS